MTTHEAIRTSGTFMLPPKPEHEALLIELRAAAKASRVTVRGTPLTPAEAQNILTLHDSLDPVMREALLAKPVPAMLAVTIRVKRIAKNDNWDLHTLRA